MFKIAALAVLALAAAPLAALADPAPTEDRYGPTPSAYGDAAAESIPLLTWPGKSAASSAPAPAPVERQAFVQPFNIHAPPPPAIRPAQPSFAPASAPSPIAAQALPPLPAAPPAPRPEPATTQQAASGQPARYYSLHREFGLTPDPAPLPQQFFTGPNNDLAAPPPPAPHVAPTGQAPGAAAVAAATRARDSGESGQSAPAPDGAGVQ